MKPSPSTPLSVPFPKPFPHCHSPATPQLLSTSRGLTLPDVLCEWGCTDVAACACEGTVPQPEPGCRPSRRLIRSPLPRRAALRSPLTHYAHLCVPPSGSSVNTWAQDPASLCRFFGASYTPGVELWGRVATPCPAVGTCVNPGPLLPACLHWVRGGQGAGRGTGGGPGHSRFAAGVLGSPPAHPRTPQEAARVLSSGSCPHSLVHSPITPVCFCSHTATSSFMCIKSFFSTLLYRH